MKILILLSDNGKATAIAQELKNVSDDNEIFSYRSAVAAQNHLREQAVDWVICSLRMPLVGRSQLSATEGLQYLRLMHRIRPVQSLVLHDEDNFYNDAVINAGATVTLPNSSGKSATEICEWITQSVLTAPDVPIPDGVGLAETQSFALEAPAAHSQEDHVLPTNEWSPRWAELAWGSLNGEGKAEGVFGPLDSRDVTTFSVLVYRRMAHLAVVLGAQSPIGWAGGEPSSFKVVLLQRPQFVFGVRIWEQGEAALDPLLAVPLQPFQVAIKAFKALGTHRKNSSIQMSFEESQQQFQWVVQAAGPDQFEVTSGQLARFRLHPVVKGFFSVVEAGRQQGWEPPLMIFQWESHCLFCVRSKGRWSISCSEASLTRDQVCHWFSELRGRN